MEPAQAGLVFARRVVHAMAPWANQRRDLNFTEEAVETRSGYDPATYRRLQEIRAQIDPDGLFHANHQIPQPSSG